MDCEYPIGFLYLVCKERERKHEKMEKVYVSLQSAAHGERMLAQ